jgi:lipoate-protein ligase A
MRLRLITHSWPDASVDTALSSAVLRRVAEGEIPATLRIFVPGRIVAFGSHDRTRPGYGEAVRAVTDAGFAAIERLAGGKAAVFHEGTIAFAWATPHADPKTGIEERFEALAGIVVDTLARLGIEGDVGETPGEYCPGRFSVHATGRKVMGVGQRLVKGAAHVGGVLVVHSPELVNAPLVPAYAALGYDWSPNATGSLADERPVTVDDAIAAFTASVAAAGNEIVESEFEPATVALAEEIAPRHVP